MAKKAKKPTTSLKSYRLTDKTVSKINKIRRHRKLPSATATLVHLVDKSAAHI